jgi:hypothetical protein
LNALREQLYSISRNREPSDRIDIYCDRATADKLQGILVRYYHDEYVKALEKAHDDLYAQFNANGGWGRFNDLPLADKS